MQQPLSFEEWLNVYMGFDTNDQENLLSSDELDELHAGYSEYLEEQQVAAWVQHERCSHK